MCALRHPNVTLFMGASVQYPELAIITEFMAGGTLTTHLASPQNEITGEMKLSYALDAAKGMEYLHSANPPFLHRDLKSSNLLLDGYGRLKVCDFGLTEIQRKEGGTYGQVGTLQWMAPEIITEASIFSAPADVYS
eukprot:Colp12_sorted_trinity150504_noHs@21378